VLQAGAPQHSMANNRSANCAATQSLQTQRLPVHETVTEGSPVKVKLCPSSSLPRTSRHARQGMRNMGNILVRLKAGVIVHRQHNPPQQPRYETIRPPMPGAIPSENCCRKPPHVLFHVARAVMRISCAQQRFASRRRQNQNHVASRPAETVPPSPRVVCKNGRRSGRSCGVLLQYE